MKKKVIAIVISVVIIAGVGTAVGVTVNKSNDKETESLVNEAVSNALASALATEESTVEESSTESTTQLSSENNKSTTAQPQVVQDENKNTVSYSPKSKVVPNQGESVENNKKTPATGKTTLIETKESLPEHAYGERIKSSEGDYWRTNIAPFYYDGDARSVFVNENNELFVFDSKHNRIYKDDWKKE